MTAVFSVFLPDLAATARLAARLAPLLRTRDVVTLTGGLGAGKTTFARSLIHALGVAGDVPSPTFTLLQIYDAPHFSVYHFDLYRLKNPAEVEEIGFDDARDGVALIEWPDRAGAYLPHDRLALTFTEQGNGRLVTADSWKGRDMAWLADA